MTKTTFIIPVKIDHVDRLSNARTVLKFMNQHIRTNIIILEVTNERESNLEFAKDLANLSLETIFIAPEGAFHRTKYLNIMLDRVETPVVVNYDIDVILDPDNMLDCQNRISSGEADVIYPYELGFNQIQVLVGFDFTEFENRHFALDFINKFSRINIQMAECGHCVFLDTSVYRIFGGENENFISYGPEDKERMVRFQKLGKRVEWRKDQYVYHLEHFRGPDSGISNPFFTRNCAIFETLRKMEATDLVEYYASQSYLSKYKNLGNPPTKTSVMGHLGK